MRNRSCWRARRIGKDKAQVALSGTQLKVYHKLLSSPGPRYQDLGAGYYDKHAQAQRRRRRNRAGPSRLTQPPGSRLTARLLPAAAARRAFVPAL
jgi:hypothetical protein